MLPLFPYRCERCGAYYRGGRPACDCLRRLRLWGVLAALAILAALVTAGILAHAWWTRPVPPPTRPSDHPHWGLPPPPLPGPPL
jgi:hypothetical protein